MNPLDIIARGILQMVGLGPEQIQQQKIQQLNRQGNSKPIKPTGQTNLFSKNGKTRNFTSPAQSANRQPTLSPVESRSNTQATRPNRPPGGFGQSPGQLSFNPNAQPSGNYQAPSVPKAKTVKPANRLTIGNALRFLSGGPLGIGGQLADMMLDANNTSLIEETFGTGRVYQDLQKSLDRQKKSNQPSQPTAQYSGMEDMSGDPIRPTRQESPQVQLGRDDPFAPTTRQALQTPEAPSTRQALSTQAPPKAPSRKQVMNDAYDALRERMRRGDISPEEFKSQALNMHREFFGKPKAATSKNANTRFRS